MKCTDIDAQANFKKESAMSIEKDVVVAIWKAGSSIAEGTNVRPFGPNSKITVVGKSP